MDRNRVLVYTTNKSYLADLLKQLLTDNDINCFLINKMDSAYLFGDIEIYVNPDNVIRAKALIEKFENH